MGYVGEEDFKALIATAVEILREEAAQGRETQQSKSAAQMGEDARSDECTGKSAWQRSRDEKSARWKNAEEVIAAASLEFAPLLHPYLGELFKLQPNRARITRSIRGAGLVTRARKSGARGLRIHRRAKMISKKFLAACCKPAIRET